MAWYKVISSTPINIDHGNGSVIAYPRGTIFEASASLRDIQLANRGRRRIFPVGDQLPSNMAAGAISAPGPMDKPPTRIKQQKQNMPRVTYRGRTFQISDIVAG